MSDKVELGEKIEFVDLNIREAWDAMTPDQQKSLKQEFFILNRYISNVSKPEQHWQKGKVPTTDEQKHYVIAVNTFFNKHWNLLQKHPKLLWMLLCMCSYDGQTKFFHQWIGFKKKEGGNSKRIKFLAELYPNKKMDEVEMLASMVTDKEIKDLARKYGMEESAIAKKLK